MRQIRIVEVTSEFGAGTRGASLGVEALRFACLSLGFEFFRKFPSVRVQAARSKLWDPIDFEQAKRIESILEVYDMISRTVHSTMAEGYFPLVISGDHSNAGGTISAIKLAHPDKRVGVIWIDAHGDIHTPFTSPSGNMHGMPVAAVLNLTNEESGSMNPDNEIVKLWESLRNFGGIAPKILPEDLVYIGIRDLEQQEWDAIHQNNILYYDNHELNRLGTEQVGLAALEHLKECDLIYVTFDVDSLDAAIVPGTGTPVTDGLSLGQAAQLLEYFWNSPKLACLEFTEINPLLDDKNQTAETAAGLLRHILKGYWD